MSVEEEVAAAAAALVAAFGEGRTEDYFAAFAPEATFVFHTTPERLDLLEDYRELWDSWVREDGFAVLACESTDARIQTLSGDAAVFMHDVETRVRAGGEEETLRERETIVFAKRQRGWLAVHEHLSPTVVP